MAVVVAAVAVAVEVGAGAETVSLISAAVEEEVVVTVSVAVAVVVGAALWLATTAAHCPSRDPSIKADSWVIVSQSMLHCSNDNEKGGDGLTCCKANP